jgi:hypothetical protein
MTRHAGKAIEYLGMATRDALRREGFDADR